MSSENFVTTKNERRRSNTRLHSSPTPRSVVIELLAKCPLRCLHCSSNSSPSASRHINKDWIPHVLKDAAALGCNEVAFSGGEPLLDSSLESHIRAARILNLSPILYTSGIVFG